MTIEPDMRRVAGRPGLLPLLLVALLYYVGVKLSLAFAVMPETLVMLWLPNSLLLATLLHYGMRRYAYLAALVIVAELAADYPTFSLFEAALFAVINLFEVTMTYVLLRWWRFRPAFEAPSDIVKFLAAGPLFGAFCAACAAAAVYGHFRPSDTTYVQLVRVWWFSDATGLVILTPLILSLWPVGRRTREYIRLQWFDGIVALLALLVVSVFLMAEKAMFHGVPIRPVVLFPFAIYAAARLSPRPATIVIVALAGAVLWVTKHGQQPYGAIPIDETVFQVQQLLFVMTVTSLSLTALLQQLRLYARELEDRVRERTAEVRAANEQLQKLAVTDSLTGLFNRRALFDLMQREMQRDLRHRHELAMIMFDIDHFKEVNDRYGHGAGDLVLRHVAGITSQLVRNSDALARYGGEEFALVAPETDEVQARQLAERIRQALELSGVAIGNDYVRITASFGVAMLHTTDSRPEDLLSRADAALYAAKSRGRNQVVMDPLRMSA